MQTECSTERSVFLDGSKVGPLWRSSTAARLTSRPRGRHCYWALPTNVWTWFAGIARCFRDARDPRLVEHSVATLIGQRVFGIALGYEDLNDHDELRHDPLMAVLAGKLSEARREDCAPVAGKSRSLNPGSNCRARSPTKYCKIAHEPAAIEALFVDLLLEGARPAAPADHPRPRRHGRPAARRSGRPASSTATTDCYCYLPLYVFCGRHLLARQAFQAVEHRRQRRLG